MEKNEEVKNLIEINKDQVKILEERKKEDEKRISLLEKQIEKLNFTN